METSRISTEQVQKLLEIEEGHFADLKSTDVGPAKLTRTISAFSNASGGELYIGVDEHEASGVKHRS